jgi:hypothetical protein
VKSKGKEEGTMIVQELVAAKDVISPNEVDNRGMPKAVPIQHLSSIMWWKYPILEICWNLIQIDDSTGLC